MYTGLYIFMYIIYIHVSQTIHYVLKYMSYHEAHLTPLGLYIQIIYTSIYRSVETRGGGEMGAAASRYLSNSIFYEMEEKVKRLKIVKSCKLI